MAEVLAELEALSAPELFESEPTAWFRRPYWPNVTTVAAAVENLTQPHYAEHRADQEAWAQASEPNL